MPCDGYTPVEFITLNSFFKDEKEFILPLDEEINQMDKHISTHIWISKLFKDARLGDIL